MSDPAAAAPCPACSKTMPAFVGGAIALRACPHCGKNFLAPAPGVPVGTPLGDLLAGLPDHQVWHLPTAAFEQAHSLIDRLAATYTLLLIRIRTSGLPWPGLACFLRTETPEALGSLSQAMRALISGAIEDDALPRVRSFDSDGATPLVICDLPEGITIERALARVGRLDLATALTTTRQTLDALDRLHGVELTSTELHPSLVVIRPGGRITFLGAAAGEHLRGMPESAAPPEEVAWTPPEVWHGLPLRPSSEVFRVVQLLGAMLLGRPLLAEDLAAAEEGRGIILSQPPWIRALLRAGLEPSPYHRVGSLAELRKILETQSVSPSILERLPPVMETLEEMRQQTDHAREKESAAPAAVEVDHEEWTGLHQIQSRVDPQAKAQQDRMFWVERMTNLWLAFRNTTLTIAAVILVATGVVVYRVALDRGWIGRGKTVLTYVRKTIQGYEVYHGPRGEGEFVLIPEGDVTVGATPAQVQSLEVAYGSDAARIFPRETPVQRVHVAAFLMDRYDITAERYKEFYDDVQLKGNHSHCHRSEPPDKDHTPGLDAAWARPMTWVGGTPPPGMASRPVVLIDWYDAYAYASWAGFRLPTEFEWERAARGDDDRQFPWGDRWDTTRAVSAERLAGAPLPSISDWKAWMGNWARIPIDRRFEGCLAPVGTCLSGASPFDILDMAGNAWQWCDDTFKEGVPAGETWSIFGRVRPNTMKAVRGGGWGSFPLDLRTSRRGGLPAASRDAYTSLRCVISVDDARLEGRPGSGD